MKYIWLYIVAIVASLGGLLSGYDTGVISGALLFINETWDLSDSLQGFLVSSVLIGAVIGAATNRFLALLKEYEQAKDVTKQRMYLETMEEILSRPGMEKLVLPKDAADRVLPLLPLMQSAPSAGKIAPQEQSSGTQLPEATLSRPRGNN